MTHASIQTALDTRPKAQAGDLDAVGIHVGHKRQASCVAPVKILYCIVLLEGLQCQPVCNLEPVSRQHSVQTELTQCPPHPHACVLLPYCRCSAGFYSAKGSRRPCQGCAAGRTTLDDPSAQRFVTDCFVKAGSGVAKSALNAADAFDIDVSGLSPEQLVALPVLECPLGYFGEGGTLGAKCKPCVAGSTTDAAGAVAATECNGELCCLSCWLMAYHSVHGLPGGLINLCMP